MIYEVLCMRTSPATINESSRPNVCSFHLVYVLRATDRKDAARQTRETTRMTKARPAGCMDLTFSSSMADKNTKTIQKSKRK